MSILGPRLRQIAATYDPPVVREVHVPPREGGVMPEDIAVECVRPGYPPVTPEEDEAWTATRIRADLSRLAERDVEMNPFRVRSALLPNPKDVEAQKTDKVRLDLLEPVADEQVARALAFGADKYGVRNYAEAPINARVYVAAIRRHLAAWLSGEDVAEDSGLHHLAHIGANVHVALAAIEAGSFVDDRPGKP